MTPASDPNSVFVLAASAVTLGYAALVAIWPYKACRRCHGGGKLRAPIGAGLRYCPHCRGTGLRLRIVRRLYNALTRPDRDTR